VWEAAQTQAGITLFFFPLISSARTLVGAGGSEGNSRLRLIFFNPVDLAAVWFNEKIFSNRF